LCKTRNFHCLSFSFLFNSLGQTFATVEAMTVATAMLKQFKFELLPGQKSPPDFTESLTLPMKDPLLVKVHTRQ